MYKYCKHLHNCKQFELNTQLEEILDNINSEASNPERVHQLVADYQKTTKAHPNRTLTDVIDGFPYSNSSSTLNDDI